MNDKNKTNKIFSIKDFPLWLLIGSAFLIGWHFYPQMPERVPSHWNLNGVVDGYSSRFWGAYGMPLLILGMYLLFEVLPLIDPRKENYPSFIRTYRIIKYLLCLFMYGIFLLVILTALGHQLRMDIIFPVSFSVLFILLGNYMTTVRHNYFVGIRTPWTLASEEVWKKTHRLGGWLWVISGLIGLLMLLINISFGSKIIFFLILGTSLFTIVYSWWCFKNLKK